MVRKTRIIILYRSATNQLEAYKNSGIRNISSNELEEDLLKQIDKLEADLKSVKRESESKYNKIVTEKAVMGQKIDFLAQEKLEAQKEIKERIENEEKVIGVLKKRFEEEKKVNQNEFLDALEAKNQEIDRLNQELNEIKEHYEEKLRSKTDDNAEVAHEYGLRVQEFKKVIDVKNDRINELEIQNIKVKDELAIEKEKAESESSSKTIALEERILELESELAKVSQNRISEAFKQNNETEEKIKQIKDVYENEKRKFQSTLKEIRKENEVEIKGLQDEYEDKINQSSTQHQEEIGYLRDQLNQVRDERQRTVGKLL